LAFQNLYFILELPNFSSKEEVKTRFRALVKLYHPDKSKDQNEKFITIKAAYDLLCNDSKKAAYDDMLKIHLAEPKKNNSYKMRADKAWIVKYKAQQAKQEAEVNASKTLTSETRSEHYWLITLCIILALLLMLFIF
jgi:curved DNA-binding protein CbpA